MGVEVASVSVVFTFPEQATTIGKKARARREADVIAPTYRVGGSRKGWWLRRRQSSRGSLAFDLSRSARRSPCFSMRASTVRIVNFEGSSLVVTSLHLIGVDTGAPSSA